MDKYLSLQLQRERPLLEDYEPEVTTGDRREIKMSPIVNGDCYLYRDDNPSFEDVVRCHEDQ